MATRLIKKAELERLFPNPIQREAFLDIMKGLIMIDPMENAKIINVIEESPVIIHRHGREVYKDG
jgi:hypothetical protein